MNVHPKPTPKQHSTHIRRTRIVINIISPILYSIPCPFLLILNPHLNCPSCPIFLIFLYFRSTAADVTTQF